MTTPQHPTPASEPDAMSTIEVTCGVCGQFGALRGMDERGFLIEHPYRRWPCRVPLGPDPDAG